MFRKLFILVLAAIPTLGAVNANAGAFGALKPPALTSASVNILLVQAWGFNPREADNRAVELEALGYHRVSGMRFGYIPSVGVTAYYVLMAAD